MLSGILFMDITKKAFDHISKIKAIREILNPNINKNLIKSKYLYEIKNCS